MKSIEIPTHHKAAVYDNPGHIGIKLTTVETPKPGPGEVLIRLTHSGVCHSDIAVMTNSWKSLPYPTQQGQVGGHEGIGTIVSFGQDAESAGLKLDDRVGIKWIAGVCGSCTACDEDDDPSCEAYRVSGYYTPGTFQEYVVGPVNYVTPIPKSLASDIAAPLLCGGVTVYAALKKTGAQPGDAVVIPGCGGGLGHLALQIGSRALGLKMIGIDVGDKKDLSNKCGAETFLDLTKYSRDEEGSTQLTKDVLAATKNGTGAAAVVVCTASNAAYAQALGFLKAKGTLVCVGIPDGESVPIATAIPGFLIPKQLRIVGSAVGTRQDAIDTLELGAKGLIKTSIALEPLENLNNIFKRMEKGQVQGRIVVEIAK